MSYPFLSAHRPGAPIHHIAWLPGQYSTLPSCVDRDRSASWIIDAVADEGGPRLVEEKGRVTYFLTTPLRIAPYVGKTAAKFPLGAQGQMRSASHVLAGTWLAFDLDGLTEAIWSAILDRLQASEAKFCSYTTWSFGLASKPGIRVRTLLFLDRGLAPQDWTRAWQVINAHYFEGLADPKTQYLHQQAGVWATTADRAPQSFRIVGGTHLLAADVLLAAAPPLKPKSLVPSRSWCGLTVPGKDNTTVLAQTRLALQWLDANDYNTWTGRALAGLKALVARQDLSGDTARSLWLMWSASASEVARAHNDDSRYNPENMWDRWVPTAAPPDGLAGSFYAAARDNARGLVESELGQGHLSACGEQAARYLAVYHYRMFQEMLRTAPREP
ncbi:MAG: hypothetical protein WAT23_18290 [Chromatiaceae bacterium]